MRKILIALAILILVSGIFTIYYFVDNNSFERISDASNNEYFEKNQNIENKADYQIISYNDYIATKPEDLYEVADLVIIGKYIKDNNCYVTDYATVVTEAQFEISKVLKGEYSSENININYYGGTVSIGEYISKQTEEQLVKKGISNLSTAQLQSETVEYIVDDTKVETNTDKECIIFLSYDKEKNYYFVLCDGYGMRELSEDGKMYDLDTKTFDTKLTDLK